MQPDGKPKKDRPAYSFRFTNEAGKDNIRDFGGHLDPVCAEAGVGKLLYAASDVRQQKSGPAAVPERVAFDKVRDRSDGDRIEAAIKHGALSERSKIRMVINMVTIGNFGKAAKSAN